MIEKKLTYRQQQALDTKAKIYETTVRLFKESSFDKLTIKKICQESGVAVGTFYLYFNSKQDILFEAYTNIDEKFKELNLDVPDEKTWIEKIYQLISVQIDITLEIDLSLVKQVYSFQILSNHIEATYSENRFIFQILLKLIEQAQLAGELPQKYSSKEVANRILRLSRGIIFDWLSHDSSYNLKELCQKELSFLIASLKNGI